MRLVLLTTGGTIASLPVPGQGMLAQGGEDLAAAAAQGPDGVTVEHRALLQVGSYALTAAQAWTIAQAAAQAAAEPDVIGVVVTHGTDTMEETAYLCDLLHEAATPIVFCGAQRSADHPAADGPGNVRDAVRLACAPHARGTGVTVAMAGRALAARTAVKVHTSELCAFACRAGRPVAEIDQDGVRVLRRPARRTSLAGTPRLEDRVALVALAIGAGERLVRAAAADDCRGVVVEAFGLGNASPAVSDAVADIVADGVPVIIATRCAHGSVAPVYGAGGGHDLRAAGAWFAGDLAGPKARILLMAALAVTRDPAHLEHLIAEHTTDNDDDDGPFAPAAVAAMGEAS